MQARYRWHVSSTPSSAVETRSSRPSTTKRRTASIERGRGLKRADPVVRQLESAAETSAKTFRLRQPELDLRGIGGVARGLVVAALVTVVAMFFTDLTLEHPLITFAVIVLTAMIFALAGLVNAIWATEQ